jgi:hypothetical protein
MTRSMRYAVRLAAVVAMTMVGQAQKPAPIDEPALRKEVNAFMDQYWALWSAGKIDELAAQIYHPMGQLNNTGHSSVAQMEKNFPATRKSLLSQNYGRSNMPNRNICVLSPTVAVVSGRGMRYKTDGSVLGEFGWTYTLLKGANGWRMVSIYSHDPAKVLTCS